MVEARDIKLKWTTSVRELAEHVHRRGDLRPGGRGGPTGPAGAEGHRALQRTRPPGYVPEMPFTTMIDGGSVQLQLSGRADGVMRPPSRPMVEEIKTVTVAPLLVSGDNPVHWAQAEIYGALLANREGLDAVEIRLTYLDITSGQTRSFTRNRTTAALTDFFEQTASTYLAFLERLAARRTTRNRAMADMAFPYDAFRPGQRRLAEAVQETAAGPGRLFVEAPTGSGKTAAVLHGALRAMGAQHISQAVYLTAKTEGRRTAEETLLRFRDRGAPLQYLVLASLADRCLHPDTGCSTEACPLAAGHYDRIRDAVDALLAAPDSGEAALEQIARTHRVCPYHLAREAAPYVDVVICDYNFVFDPRASLPFFADSRNDRRILLADEAHNLPERAREMFSAGISTARIEAVERAAGRTQRSIERTAAALRSELSTLERKNQMETDASIVPEPLPSSLTASLETFIESVEAGFTANNGPRAEDDALLLCYFETVAFVRALGRDVESDITTLVRRDGDLTLTVFARDPAPHLRRVLDAAKCAAVFFSGTLSPVDFYTRLLGGEADDPRSVQGAAFPAKNRLVVAAAHLSTRYADRERHAPAVADAIFATVRPKKGNYLVFSPSHAYLTMIANAMQRCADEAEIIVQSPTPTAAERKKFTDKFKRKRPRKTLLGLAVLGGRFGESLDLPGDALIGALVVSPGLPPVSFEKELIRAHFEETEGRGFEYAYVYPGMNKVLQAAGRVHRTETDRGIVVLIGKRFTEPTYKKLLPWPTEEIRVCRSAEAIEKTVAAFWKEKDLTPKRSR